MRNKNLKLIISVLLVMTLTMTNFLFVGSSLISYAVENVSTNHKNVEFEVYFKTSEGKEVETLEKEINDEETYLYLQLNVKKEGYFNGQINFENSNFIIKDSDSEYIKNIENNTIYLNQIHVGMTEEIKVKIEPTIEEQISVDLLNMSTKINLNGIYRDSKEKDINIQADREVKLQFVENNTAENVLNEIKVITNKIVEIEGQEKRVLQFSYNVGLKENNYPIKEINSKIILPTLEEKVEILKTEYLNNSTSMEYNEEENVIELTLKNEPTNEGKIMWKQQGNENIIFTCICDKDTLLENMEITAQEKITFYNSKEIETENKIAISGEELDSIIEVNVKNAEDIIYKGKMNAGIDRQYEIKTEVKVNLARAISNIIVNENNSEYVVENTQTQANCTYTKTIINKQQMDEILGQEGIITIYDQNGSLLQTITGSTSMEQDGSIVINYEEKVVSAITIKTSEPVKEGIIEFKHIKTISENIETIKSATELKDKVTAQYNYDKQIDVVKESEAIAKLEEATTKSNFEIDKETLSTVVTNNVEIKAKLVSNSEKYDLYKNPKLTIELSEQVENIIVESINLFYEDELKVKKYYVNGRIIDVELEGEQTQYKDETIEGATIVINANVQVNRKATTSEQIIKMTYQNEKGGNGTDEKTIKIVAPKDITVINSVNELGIETLGEEQVKQVVLQKGTEERQLEAQLEIINNNENAIENMKILGYFPTNNDSNNMGIQIAEAISLQEIENVKIYYSENTNATDDIDNNENGWTENIENPDKVSKYLIIVEKLESQSSIKGLFKYTVPANLEYNQTAKMGYEVKYTDTLTKVESSISATAIEMQTGIGPKAEIKLTATNNNVKNGEVIQYKIEVSNTGTEDITNLIINGKVPEGTVMIEPEENFEYTGASYYKELNNTSYEETIENLKVGEVITKQYEVRVKNDVAEGTTLSNIAEIKYAEVTKQSDEIKHTTTKGNIRISVKRITDRKIDLYSAGAVQYFAIIENISGDKQENVKVKTNLPEILEVDRLTLISGMEKEYGNIYSVDSTLEQIEEIVETDVKTNENIKTEKLQYQEEINIGVLEAGEVKVLSYDMSINKLKNDSDKIEFSVTVKDGQEEYNSNVYQDTVKNVEVEISMTADTEGQYIKAGDAVDYKIVVKNETNADIKGLVMKDAIPLQLSIETVTKNGEIVQGIDGNNIEIPLTIEANSNFVIKISTVVNYSEGRDTAEPITNSAYVEMFGEKIATTTEVSHIIQANENNNTTLDEEENNNDLTNNDVAKGYSTISGVAWYDENRNGQKEQGEKLLNNIKVKLLNTETNNFVKQENGNILEATTNENGIYVLDKIGNGQYIIVFEYDNSLYTLTKYKAEGVSEAENSNVINNELIIENEKKQVASTDIININNNDISNINIGLTKITNFDLKLDKYVSKILIQDASGTTVREYNDATMAKVELDAKKINGSTVIVEYKINVTNNGELEGYAKKIADYAPTDMKFNSELNKQWYQVGDVIYTSALANEIIQPGETKTVTLILTKTMTENNTGLIPNTAEIVEDYNELGIPDINSVPGNRATEENDFGIAEVVLSIRTGGIVYITTIIIAIALLGGAAIVILKKKKTQGNQ